MSGDLSADQHWYSPLYPLLLAPWAWAGISAGSLIVDSTLYVVTYFAFEEIANRFGLRRLLAIPLFIVTTLLPVQLGKTWIEPWTTTVSAALLWWSLALAARVIDEAKGDRKPRRLFFALGVLLVLIPFTRPSDVVISIFIGAAISFKLLWEIHDWRSFMVLVATGLVALVPVAVLYLEIWGPQPSPYANLGSAIGFNFAWIGWKAYLIFVEPRPWFPGESSLLKLMPWLIFGFAGSIVGLFRSHDRQLSILLFVVSVAYLGMMVSYIDLLPSGLWRFNNIHYFKWLVPLFGLFAWDLAVSLRAHPVITTCVLGTVVAVSSLSATPAPARGNRARLLVYQGRNVSFLKLYMSRTTIVDRIGVMRNFFDFHQVLGEQRRIYVNALRRDFVGEVRVGGASWSADWPKSPAGFYNVAEIQPKEFGPLLGRFEPRWSLGVPCWLPGQNCGATLSTSRQMEQVS